MKSGGFDGPVFAATASFALTVTIEQAVMVNWSKISRSVKGDRSPTYFSGKTTDKFVQARANAAKAQSLSRNFSAGGWTGVLLFNVACAAMMMSEQVGLDKTMKGGMKPFNWGWVIAFAGLFFMWMCRQTIQFITDRKISATAANQHPSIFANGAIASASLFNFVAGLVLSSRNCYVLASCVGIPMVFLDWTTALTTGEYIEAANLKSNTVAWLKVAYIASLWVGFVVGTPIGMAYNEMAPAVLNCLLLGFAGYLCASVSRKCNLSVPWTYESRCKTQMDEPFLGEIVDIKQKGKEASIGGSTPTSAGGAGSPELQGENSFSPLQSQSPSPIAFPSDAEQHQKKLDASIFPEISQSVTIAQREWSHNDVFEFAPAVARFEAVKPSDPLSKDSVMFFSRAILYLSGASVSLGLVAYHHIFM